VNELPRIERVRHEFERRELDVARIGDPLRIGGPKGSAINALDAIDSHVFIGDENAVPAITRRLEELPLGVRVLLVLESAADTEWPWFASRASLQVVWVRRKDPAHPAAAIVEALRRLQFPAGQCFVWVAIESNAARAVRSYLRDERGVDKQWIKAAGCWQRGVAGSHDTLAAV
jgi:NADPH-dependent ferric siderophore reductase